MDSANRPDETNFEMGFSDVQYWYPPRYLVKVS